MKKTYISFILLVSYFILNTAQATLISVRLIKSESSKCISIPRLYLLNPQSAYTIAAKPWFNGENSREIFFEIDTNDKNIPIETIQIEAIGVKIYRAIVGRTDVPFRKIGDRYELALVRDTTDGRHVQTAYQNPKGGPFMWIYHNSEERIGGDYAKDKYPIKALAASLNYEVACQEMLRLMGNMSGINQSFNGELILLNCESSAPRGHLDFPPHWHLQHWQHGHNKEYGLNWREKQYIIPHYYLDSLGNIIRNKQSVRQNYKAIAQEKSEYLQGDTCTWTDAEGNLIFKQVISEGALHFMPNGGTWTLKPKIDTNSFSVIILKDGIVQATSSASDDGIVGKTSIRIIYPDSTFWSYEINYDPYTGKNILKN